VLIEGQRAYSQLVWLGESLLLPHQNNLGNNYPGNILTVLRLSGKKNSKNK